MKKLLKWVIGTVLALTIAVPLLLYFLQEKMLFQPWKMAADTQLQFPGNWQERWFTMRDSTQLHGLDFFADGATKTVLYFHGNAGNLEGWGQVGQQFVDRGYNVCIIDYRGYGKSQGSIKSEKQLILDATAIYHELSAGVGEENIILYGRSLGSGIAAQIAASHDPAALLLETPYYSMTHVAKQHMGWLPIKLILKYKLKTFEHLPKVDCPIAAIHGTKDRVIPTSNAHLLKGENPGMQLSIIEGAGHNNLAQSTAYFTWLDEALANTPAP